MCWSPFFATKTVQIGIHNYLLIMRSLQSCWYVKKWSTEYLLYAIISLLQVSARKCSCDFGIYTWRNVSLLKEYFSWAFSIQLHIKIMWCYWNETLFEYSESWWGATTGRKKLSTWWRHQKETFSALLALCVRNSPATGELPAQKKVTWSFDVFLDLSLSWWLSKQSWCRWFETPWRSLCNATVTEVCHYRLIMLVFHP